MLNNIIITGRLTTDPIRTTTSNEISKSTAVIACERDFLDANKERQTDFIPILAWRNEADFLSKYFVKGKLITVKGALQTRSYEDKHGNKRTAFEIVVEKIYFADSDKSKLPTTERVSPSLDAPQNIPMSDIESGAPFPYPFQE